MQENIGASTQCARGLSRTIGIAAWAIFLACTPRAFTQSVLLSTQSYTILLDDNKTAPSLYVETHEGRMFRLPVASGLSSPDHEEELSQITLNPVSQRDGAQVLEASANSSLWKTRRFVWKFFEDRIEYRQFAKGSGAIQRCYFFGNGTSGNTNGRMPLQVSGNSTVYADRYYSPRANLGDTFEYPVSMPQSVGVAAETARPSEYDAFWMNRLFAPPPLALSFHRGTMWTTVGLGAKLGEYQFNGFEYSGSLYAGASLWVNYQGRKQLEETEFSSPTIALHFAHDPVDGLSSYVRWMDANGFSTHNASPVAKWHRMPIFCGWAEQTVEAKAKALAPREYATQANYEAWLAILDKRGIPFGTVVIDDKWQKSYGAFEVDETKWPDMSGFISRQHAEGHRVLLWLPALQVEGLSPEMTATIAGKPVAADITNPKYEAMMRAQLKHLVKDLGVDGFKEDWIDGMPDFSAVRVNSPLFGMEFVRKFQFVLHDETHKWKSDALIETQTPNPLFRESSDVLRLNDIWFGSRDLPKVMLERAKVAWAAGWTLVDTDNGGATNLEEWHRYMRFQPELGIPALYFVSKTESTKEEVPEGTWHELAQIWKTTSRICRNAISSARRRVLGYSAISMLI